MTFDYPHGPPPTPPSAPQRPNWHLPAAVASGVLLVGALGIGIGRCGADSPAVEIAAETTSTTTETTSTTVKPTTTVVPQTTTSTIDADVNDVVLEAAAVSAWNGMSVSDRDQVCQGYELFGDEYTMDVVRDSVEQSGSESYPGQNREIAFALLNVIRRECGGW